MGARRGFSGKYLGIPYALFLAVFVILPLFILFTYAFTNGSGHFTLENLTGFFTDPNTLGTLFYSLLIAFSATVLCLAIGYPVAYILAMNRFKRKPVLVMLFVIPMWINFALRITALRELLALLEGNLAFHPFINSVIGMTYVFLPFMILPIYNQLSELDRSLPEAAADLGAGRADAFMRITLPLSMPGVAGGAAMVFLPAMTNYVVPDMLYNNTYIMGSLIGSCFSIYDWHNGSMIALILLAIVVIMSLAADTGEEDGRQEARI